LDDKAGIKEKSAGMADIFSWTVGTTVLYEPEAVPLPKAHSAIGGFFNCLATFFTIIPSSPILSKINLTFSCKIIKNELKKILE
jgi:hypothetical protein